MRPMNLTDTERLILANQHEILAYLKKEDKDYHFRMAENLRDGHKWLYEQGFDHFSENLPEEKVEHVIQILGIYGDMHDSYDQLEDKTGIKKDDLKFRGFDGNNECELMHFADALRKSDRFEATIGKRAKNSHMPTTETYKRMIQRWKELGEPHYPYTREMIIAILAEWVHPSRR